MLKKFGGVYFGTVIPGEKTGKAHSRNPGKFLLFLTKCFFTDVKDEEKEKPKDGESGDVKYPYPKAVFFIISTEFCERFSFYGMKSKLNRSS
jgi:hypothetical protein